jgi:hypothetical protein
MSTTLKSEPSYTIDELCAVEGICNAKYYQLRKKGLGPQELRFPGSRIVRITAEARREWHARMNDLAQTQEAQIERERLHVITSISGKKAAASALHVYRQRQRKRAEIAKTEEVSA